MGKIIGLYNCLCYKVDGPVKSRHSGENRSPDGLQLVEKTGFRLSPEWRKTVFWDFLRDRQGLDFKSDILYAW